MLQSVRCAGIAILAAGALSWSVAARAATDVCAIYKQHVPKDMGLALDKAMSVTREFCQAWSAGNKDTVLLRVMKTGNPQVAVAGTRQSKVNSGNGATADESGLGAGAWSARTKDSIEITFGAKGQFVMVMMQRGAGLSDADVAKARDFAKAVAKSL
jgi:hypothetical protein